MNEARRKQAIKDTKISRLILTNIDTESDPFILIRIKRACIKRLKELGLNENGWEEE